MATSVIFEEQVEIPLNIASLNDFRQWAMSDGFPECGRIDFVSGRIEIDMSPEDFFSHGTLKGKLYAGLLVRVDNNELGYLVVDRTRVSCPDVELSVEPDIVFISHESLDSGRVRLVPKAGAGADRYSEVEGAPDLIVEIVSDSSATKDTVRLPKAYFRAGVREFWLIDARSESTVFQIYTPGQSEFEPVTVGEDGFQRSSVLGCGFRLQRRRDVRGRPAYDLHVAE
jgi:Uma2 family endonuclease